MDHSPESGTQFAVDGPRIPRPPGARRKGIQIPDQPRSKIPSDHPSVSHGYFKSFDGTKIFYSLEGKGKPLIFCYGLVCSSLHWTYQIDHFRNNYQAVWFDYRGHHNSDTPADMKSITIENIAQDLGLLLDELKIKDAVFLGHSMGVNVVLDFYRQFPDRVAGMVLANGTAKRPLETLFQHNFSQPLFKMLRKAQEFSPRLVDAIWKSSKKNPLTRSIVAMGGFNPHLTPQADIDMYIEQVADMDPRIFIQLIDSYEAFDATPWLHTIKAPTLLIAGADDNITPVEQQELMNQLIPNSRLEIVRHGSHCPQMDLVELVNMKIERFLGELDYASSHAE